MKIKVKKILFSAVVVLGLGVSLLGSPLIPQAAAQTSADEVCAGIASASGTGCNGSNTSLNNIIANGINILSIIIGIVAIVMIMFAGFKYITAQGDSGSVNTAKNTLIYAVVGLLIVALAQSIVHFVLHAATTAPSKPK